MRKIKCLVPDGSAVIDLPALYRTTGDIPWVVGLSGGKDSTAVTMVLLEAIESLPPMLRKRKRVFVTCVNTLVEAPPVIEHVHGFIGVLKAYVRDRDLPVEVVELTPSVDQTFWSNVIGRGYPVPNRSFRWCTDRMKVRPQTDFLKNNVDIFGSPPVAHFLLGTRFDESAARKGTMDANTDKGTDLHQHGTIPTSAVIRPIEEWTADDVWDHLLKPDWVGGGVNPFLEVNERLATLYRDAASGECPVIHDPSRQTCAGSRFGCWTCTVVDVDSSLREMIETGGTRYESERLGLLADLRDELKVDRNKEENRVKGRNRRGKVLVQRDRDMALGPYTMDYRQRLLDRLLDIQERFNEGLDEGSRQVLIDEEEVAAIQRIWAEEEVNLAKVFGSLSGALE